MPAGLRHADRLPEPIFTPSTKATEGHDLNIGDGRGRRPGGPGGGRGRRRAVPGRLRAGGGPGRARRASSSATPSSSSGFIDGELSICDEVLTPDSSRFWPADDCAPGTNPPSFDKQPLRDWLEASPGTSSHPRRRCPPRSSSATSDPLRRRLRAGLRPPVGRLVRCLTVASARAVLGPGRGAAAPGIADPQGATIERALPALGLDGVTGVRAGKAFRFEIDAADEADGPGPGRPWWPTGCWPTRSSRSRSVTGHPTRTGRRGLGA